MYKKLLFKLKYKFPQKNKEMININKKIKYSKKSNKKFKIKLNSNTQKKKIRIPKFSHMKNINNN
jgi:hypothetical protein